jgi:type IV pilus assembly protein PilM
VEKKNDSFTPKQKFNLKELFFFLRNLLLATQNTIGIDIGQGYIKIVQLQRSRKGYLLTDYKVRAIPPKAKENFKEKEKFAKEFIKEFLSQSRIKTSLGRMVIEGNGVFVFSLLLPRLSEKDLRGTVSIELKKRLPYHYQIDIKDLFFNYFITERFETEETSQVMVTCIAVNNTVLDRQLNFLKSLQLRPVIINTVTDALGNLIKTIGNGQYAAVLDMGAKGSYLNFYKNGLLQFSREIPIGGEQFTHAILKTLSSLDKNVSFEDAEAFKKQCGIPTEEEADTEFYTDVGAVRGVQVITAMRPLLERLITEISRTITFYFRTYKINALDVFYLTGGASRIKNIDKFLSTNLNNFSIKHIEKLNPLKAIKRWVDVGVLRHELIMEEASPHLAASFGLCIHKGGRVNLVPPKEKIEQKAIFLMFLIRLTFPLILITILSFYAFSYRRVLAYKTTLAKAKVQIKQLVPTVKEIKEYLAFKKSLSHKETLLALAIGRQPLWWGILKELSNITPREVTLSQLIIEPKEKPKKMVLIGEVVSEYTNLDLAISQYTLNLNESPYFTNVRLISSERDIYSSIPKATFEIVCDLVY